MSMLAKQVATAQRRLRTAVWFDRLTWAVLIAAAAWTLVTLVERLFAVGVPVWLVGAGLGGAAVMAASVWAFARKSDALAAATAVDVAAKLKERVSTAWAVRGSTDEFAQAARADGERIAAQVHIPTHLPYRIPELLPWSALAVVAAVLLAWLLPTFDLLKQKPTDPAVTGEIQEAALIERKNVAEALQEQRKRLAELAENNPDLKDLTLALEPLDLPDKPELTPDDVRKEAVAKLNHAADLLDQKRDEDKEALIENMKRMLSQLETQSGDDPASQLGESLKSGDFKGAQDKLAEIQNQLEQAAKNTEDKELQQKMQQAQQQMERLSEQMNKLSNMTQMQKELQNKAGMSEEQAKQALQQLSQMDPKEAAKQLQQQLQQQGMDQQQAQDLVQKLQQNQLAQQQMQQLAKQLAQAAQQMQQQAQQGQQQQGQQGQPSQGQQGGQQSQSSALADAMSQLSDMEAAEQLMNDLEAQMAELNNLKDSVLNGQCQNPGNQPGQKPGQMGGQGPQYGQGYGSKIGKERVAFDYKPDKANTRAQGGQIIAQLLIDGPQKEGEATAEVQEAVAAAVRDAEDAVERGAIPRQYHNVTRRYFEALAGLKRTEKE